MHANETGTADTPPDAAGIYNVWPGAGLPPGSAGTVDAEQAMVVPSADTPGRHMVRNVTVPTLTHFPPADGTANGTALIIAPGGAFHFLMVDHEGYDMARVLAAAGVNCFVLKYRVMPTPIDDAQMLSFRDNLHQRLLAARATTAPGDTPLTVEARRWGEEDGRQAIRRLRENAGALGIDPARIGIAGFSAGGGVAMGAALEHDAMSRPDFVGAIYPALRGDIVVPVDSPALFLAISEDDASVPPAATARLYAAWREAGHSAELHIFADGGHGWGMTPRGHGPDGWIELFTRWMSVQNLLGPPPSSTGAES